MAAQPEFQQRLKGIEHLLGEIEAAADPKLRTAVQELVQLVMDLHGAGLERMLELIRAPGDGGETLVQKLGRDELVASLLILYGLHPLDVETRVTQALVKVSPRLRAHEGEVELLSVRDGAVRLRLHANGHGCGSTSQALKEMVEDAVYKAAPDVTSLFIEGADDKSGFVPLEMLGGRGPANSAANGLSLAANEKGGL
jgi:Fe-S cluster biogenesis protein NfuA